MGLSRPAAAVDTFFSLRARSCARLGLETDNRLCKRSDSPADRRDRKSSIVAAQADLRLERRAMGGRKVQGRLCKKNDRPLSKASKARSRAGSEQEGGSER